MRTRGNTSVCSSSIWNLEVLVFKERGKPQYPEKTSRSKGENQQQTQPTSGVDARIRTWATLVGSERSHHCDTLAPVPTELQSQMGASHG